MPRLRKLILILFVIAFWSLFFISVSNFEIIRLLITGFFALGFSWRILMEFFDLGTVMRINKFRSSHPIDFLKVEDDCVTFTADFGQLNLDATKAVYKNVGFGRWTIFSYKSERITIAFDKIEEKWYYLH